MAKIWPIGGGKGGSGKSFISGSLAMLLAREGYSTLLVDLDLGAANLHTILGVPFPEKCLSDFIGKRSASLLDVAVPTATANLHLISGAMNCLDIANLAHEQKNRILRHLARLPYDYVLLDLGAGTAFNTIDFFTASNLGIFVTSPEPTSIENVYRLIRSVYFRKIRQVLTVSAFKAVADEAEAEDPSATVTNPPLLLAKIRQLDPEKSAALEETLRAFTFRLVVNQYRKTDNPNLGRLICKVIEKHLGLNIDFLGNVAFDDRVHNAVCRRMPFLDLYPYTQTALDMRECSRHLADIPVQAAAAQAGISRGTS